MAIFARLIEFARANLQSRRTVAGISTLIIVLAIPLTVYIAGQQQDIRQQAYNISNCAGSDAIQRNSGVPGRACDINTYDSSKDRTQCDIRPGESHPENPYYYGACIEPTTPTVSTTTVVWGLPITFSGIIPGSNKTHVRIWPDDTAGIPAIDGGKIDASHPTISFDTSRLPRGTTFAVIRFAPQNANDQDIAGLSVPDVRITVEGSTTPTDADLRCVVNVFPGNPTVGVPMRAEISFSPRVLNSSERASIHFGPSGSEQTLTDQMSQNKTYTYANAGQYGIKLSVKNTSGQDMCKNPRNEWEKTVNAQDAALTTCILTLDKTEVDPGEQVTATIRLGRPMTTSEVLKFFPPQGEPRTLQNLQEQTHNFTIASTAEPGHTLSARIDLRRGETFMCTSPVSDYSKSIRIKAASATETPTNTPTATATSSPTVTGSIPPTNTETPTGATLNFTLNLGQLGGPTRQIKTQRRNILVEFYDNKDKKIGSTITSDNALQYNSSTGKFTGSVTVNGIDAGTYSIKIKTDRYLKKRLPQLVTLSGSTQQIPLTFDTPLVVGNVTGDELLDIQDYNALVGCFGPKATTSSCTNKVNADLNDDGPIDEFDYNLLLRNFSVRRGD